MRGKKVSLRIYINKSTEKLGYMQAIIYEMNRLDHNYIIFCYFSYSFILISGEKNIL